ncbi:pleiotropic regulatory protein RsmS [Vibrio sp. HN007]|uniref:pleiotropic regulatory protein RsmS n=1 Tax=Vibrio iocasae TaxID=3098914 RepID=UPI0035D4C694
MTDKKSNALDNAPEEIKLAVDLIYLLESNEIDPKIALEAIDIVKQDLQSKVDAS